MIELDHLQTYQFNLTTQGLLFVGSGKKIPKKEYIFNTRQKTVFFLNEHAFFDLLVKKDLVDEFENYCMQCDGDLYVFLYKTCHLTSEDIKPAILYDISVGDALDPKHLPEINALMRDKNQRAYIPGSSLKGAIRTALLFEMIQKDERKHTLSLDKKTKIPEEEYLHTLGLKGVKPNDAVNSIMRGIQVSDSEPISNQQLTLGTKTDSNPRGITHDINLCRECIMPGTCIRFRLTLDQSILKGAKVEITVQSIMAALDHFYAYQQQTYASKFTKPADAMSSGGKCLMTFGGGAGFFTKSLAYPYLGEDEGLMWTSNFLHQNKSFNKHHHDSDPRNFGISPHTMKYTRYQNKLYSFGTCEVSIQ